MKKVLILTTFIVCLILVGCSKSKGTIEEITGVEFSEISYIKAGAEVNQDIDYDVEEFINIYKNAEFKKITGGYGSTTHIYFVCYDANDEVLFTLVSVGNQDKFFIKKGNFDITKDDSSSLYQQVE